MSTKPKFFLLDAGPIIELHQQGLWRKVVERAELVIPRVVAEREVQFCRRDDGQISPISLTEDEQAGRVTILDCEPSDLRVTFELFDTAVQQSVDPGELHALTLLRIWEGEPLPRFCSADRMAVICLCLLGFADQASSLEGLLIEIGLGCTLHRKYSVKALEGWVNEGRRRRLLHDGLA